MTLSQCIQLDLQNVGLRYYSDPRPTARITPLAARRGRLGPHRVLKSKSNHPINRTVDAAQPFREAEAVLLYSIVVLH